MVQVNSTFLLATIVFSSLIFSSLYQDTNAEKSSFAINDNTFIEGQSLIITGQSSPNDEIIIRLVAPDGGIKVFEQITVDDSGSFNYVFTWPFAQNHYQFGVYVMDTINVSQDNTLSDKIDIKFISNSTLQEYLDFAEKIVCGPGTELINRECTIISQAKPTPIESDTQSTSETKFTCGKGTEPINGICQIVKAEEPKGGGCLIATAAFGSELAPQVQQLRELRDNKLLQTESGQSFMNTFNEFYYSFSPHIADYERENPLFKEAVKLGITPMISSLSILNFIDMNSETEVLGYGISLILLNIGIYFGIPAVVIIGIRTKL